MSHKKFFVFFLVLTLGLSSLSFAQRQTGAIRGLVVDKEKTPLPGATVSLSGPSLMGTRSFVTTEEGVFRFPSLLPGEYAVRAEMANFKTKNLKGIIVGVGKTTEITIDLEMAAVEEEVTVVAASPVVDLQATKMNVNYTAQFLTSIPMNRDLYDIQNSIPGAISEGVDYRRTSVILGGTVRSQLYALDGVPMNDPATFYSMANINIDVYDEIEFEIGAHPAEVGQTDSTYINIVTKSGGNKFSGGATFYYTGKDLAEDMLSAEQIKTLNVNPPEKYTDSKDFSLNLGGPIIKDKIWFFVNGRRLTWKQAYPGTPETRMARLGIVSPHYNLEHQEWLGFAKLTFQVAKNIRYMGMLHYNHIYEPIYSNSVGTDTAYEGTEIWDHENTYTTTHQVNFVINQNTFADVRGTYIYRFFPIHSITQNDYTYYDYTQKVYWGASPYNDEYVRKKVLASASFTRFQDGWLGGDHEFKAGLEFEQSEYHRDWYRANPYYSYWDNYLTGNPYYYNSTSQGRLRIRTSPGERGQWDVQDHARRFSGYIQDAFAFGRFAVNVGLRLDYSYQYEPEQTRPALQWNARPPLLNPQITDPNAIIFALNDQFHALSLISPFDALTTPYKKPVEFTTLSPRIGIVYDLFGDNRTAVKLSFGRYYEPIWTAKYNGGQIFGANSANFYWNDLNRNKLMDLPPTDSYIAESYPNQDPNYSYYADLKSPYMNEILFGVEHEVVKDFKLGLQFMWKQNKNIVDDVDTLNGYDTAATDSIGLIWLPFSFADPGWDGILNTSDDQTMTVYGLRADRPAPSWRGTNPPEAKREYQALILTFEKRMSNKWQLEGSVVYSSYKGNAGADYSATEGESGMFDNPNTLINTYGPTPFDRPLQIKIMGSYILPYDFIISAYFQYRSGSPWGRSLARVYFPSNYMGFGTRASYYAVNAETPGSRRYPSFTNLDIRIEKKFKIGAAGSLAIYADIFNLGGRGGINVNLDPAGVLRTDRTPVTYTLSTTYGLVTSAYGVRSVRFGARYAF